MVATDYALSQFPIPPCVDQGSQRGADVHPGRGIKTDPLTNNLRGDPRYKAFLRMMNLPE